MSNKSIQHTENIALISINAISAGDTSQALFDTYHHEPITPDALQSKFKTYEMPFAIQNRSDETHLGYIVLNEINWQIRSAQCHFALFNTDTTILQDALQIILNYAFLEANLHRIKIITPIMNTQVIETLSQMNFAHEGTFRQHIYFNGQYEDVVIYSILKNEWLSQ